MSTQEDHSIDSERKQKNRISGLEELILFSEKAIERLNDLTNPALQVDKFYDFCNSGFSQCNYNDSAVQEFINNYLKNYSINKNSIRTEKKCKNALGMLSAAIINNLKQESQLELSPEMKLECLGYNMNKDHIINYNGDAGDYLATYMKKGTINVYGNALNIGEGLKGGVLNIYGNVKEAGRDIENGYIQVYGQANSIGKGMKGGKIIVTGDSINAGEDIKEGHIQIMGDVKRAGKKQSGGEIIIGKNAEFAGSEKSGGYMKIEGDVVVAGSDMKDGLLEILGDVKVSAGFCMTGGEIYIQGNVLDSLGREMSGGKITVEGYVKKCIGPNLTGGTVNVNGKYNRVRKTKDCSFYSNGMRVKENIIGFSQ